MNAASAPVPNSKAAEQRAHEPSMEEILASIRRIIADDQVLPLNPRSSSQPAAPGAPPASNVDDAYEPVERTPLRQGQEAPMREVSYGRAETRPVPQAETDSARNGARIDRGPTEFHSGLASIFANDRQASRQRPEAPVAAAAPVRQDMSASGPQLVASAVTGPRELSQPAVLYPADSERGVAGSAGSRTEADLGSEAPRAAQTPSNGAAVVREMRSAQATSSQPRPPETRVQPTDTRGSSAQQVDLMRDERRSQPATLENSVERLLSDQANATVASAFQALNQSVALPDGDVIESLTRDLLRPMLKQWLDDNLPVMVEKLVRAEIERVARGGR